MTHNPLIDHQHAAWMWVDIRGIGKRWELAVPKEDEFDDSQLNVLFPLAEFEDAAENYRGCPVRMIVTPSGTPTEQEIEAAREEAEEFGEEFNE